MIACNAPVLLSNSHPFSEGASRAVAQAQKPDVQLLRDEELPKLYESTNFQNKLEVQRYNIVILGCCLGWRPQSMIMMKANMFREVKLENGRTLVEVHAGSMKNLQQSMDKQSIAVFKQSMVTGDDPRCHSLTALSMSFACFLCTGFALLLL